jgi:hypothetical protein
MVGAAFAGGIVGLVVGFFLTASWLYVQDTFLNKKRKFSMPRNGEDVEL